MDNMKESDESPSFRAETAPFIELPRRKKTFVIGYLRYYVVFLAMLSASIGIACSFAFNFAVVCNVNATVRTQDLYEENPSYSPIMHFPTYMMSWLFSAYSIGNIVCLFVIIFLCKNVSVRKQVILGSAMSTISTALIPVCYDLWPHSTLLLKTLQGAAVAPTIPLIGYVTAHWTPLAEVGFIVAILSAYSQFGILFTMATSGVACTYFGWRSIFYVHAMASTLVLVAWIVLFRDHPDEHPWLHQSELDLIKVSKHASQKKKQAPVPYRKYFAHASVWAVLIAAIGNYNGISPLIVFASSILKKGVGLSDIETGNYNSVSFAVQLLLKLVSGRISDKFTGWNETTKARVFNTISCGLSGLLMLCVAFVPVDQKVICAILITLTQAMIGFNSAGFNKAAMIVTRQYANFTMTIIGVIISTSTILEPFLVFYVAPETTWEQWSWLFILHGSILMISNLAFCVMIRAKPAGFTSAPAEKPSYYADTRL